MFENLGNKLKTLRVKGNFSRQQIAELTGVSVSMIGLYESGGRLPSLHMIVKLAANCDDPHILRSVGIAEGMMQTALNNLQRLKAD